MQAADAKYTICPISHDELIFFPPECPKQWEDDHVYAAQSTHHLTLLEIFFRYQILRESVAFVSF